MKRISIPLDEHSLYFQLKTNIDYQILKTRLDDIEAKGVQTHCVLTTSPLVTRSARQNAHIHRLLQDISNNVEHYNKKFSVTIWKRLTTNAFLQERNEKPLLIPSLNGVGFDSIYEKTSTFSIKLCAEYIEWLYAFLSEHSFATNYKY